MDAECTALNCWVRFWFLLLFSLLAPAYTARAHVGSKDVFEQVNAGPYKLFVTIRMPLVIPGVAAIEVRSSGAPIDTLSITPLPLTGEASKHPPTADSMKRSSADGAFYTGSLWLMATGSWQVRFDINGVSGKQTVSVPVAAVAVSTLKMQQGMGILLGILGMFLVLSMAGIVGASVREVRLGPGARPSPKVKRRAAIATAMSVVVMALAVWLGNKWWRAEAASYSMNVFRPLAVDAVLRGDQLELAVHAFGEGSRRGARSNNDFLPDHGHLMHLYAIRWPEMDAAFHLHPELAAPGVFRISLPSMPAGEYSLYGDVVHANGFPETLLSKITVPGGMHGGALNSEDASAHPQPLSQGELGTLFRLPDGYTMVWDRPATISANTAYSFRFRLLDVEGKPAEDMQPYLGMAGHAAFVKTDGTVFAHTHPEGSAAMPSLMLANGGASEGADMTMSPDMKMDMRVQNEPISNTVEFPYGFPSAGRYRIFVQMKHALIVETGVFDATVQ
jgi:hypothetical protein